MVRAMGMIAPAHKRLNAEFLDSRGSLLADPPTSPGATLDPPTLILAHISGDDAEGPAIPWEDLEKHIAAVTGKTVEDAPFENSRGQIDDIKNGKITIVALHAAETPFLVNNCGFQPQAVYGDKTGVIGNHLNIIVPTDSQITKAADIRSHSLVCTVPNSITGYRAAVALLMKNEGLRPNVDYAVTWSLGQKKSIHGVIKKTFTSAAVSDDKLQSMVHQGKINPADFRTIYSSEVIPRTTIGYFYNLKPELAAKIRGEILSFKPDRPVAAKETGEAESANTDLSGGTSNSLRFIAIDYKRDFELVRLIDDSFDPRLGAKPPKAGRVAEPSTTATTSAAHQN
ncbi:MAG TPA: PhnD/SsuA/transferrin family substrate-binding protein [Tepidisphaeraceae bacterium]|nr:PhnD/SsuA/transferrin family substrate-binding protein [Tepidisphaeraceae bacterium]